MHPSALSRRQFLKLATLGAASALLSACQEKTNLPPTSPAGPSPTPRPTEPPVATTSTVRAQPTLNPAPPLQMLENSVFSSGVFMLTPFKSGGVTILHNLESFLNNCGFGCGLNGWTPYDRPSLTRDLIRLPFAGARQVIPPKGVSMPFLRSIGATNFPIAASSSKMRTGMWLPAVNSPSP